MSKLENAVKNSGSYAFTMQYKPDFPINFLCGGNPLSKDGKVVLGEIIHSDDYQPFCDVISDIVSRKREEIKAHARLLADGAYRWYYISAVPEFRRDGALKEINGMMFDVTEYLDCEGEDAVMRSFRNKAEASMASQDGAPRLLDILGKDYLEKIQQPFSHIKGLYSQITDGDGKVIAIAYGQDKGVNLNKMSYQRKKSIRVKHVTVGSWIVAGESLESINESAPLLDTMVQTVSEIANSYVVIGEEMENSQKANKLLGQNFEDQILINNIYSLILQSKDTSSSFGSIIPLIKEYFGLDDLMFCTDETSPIKVYRWDESGNMLLSYSEIGGNERIDRELDNNAVVCICEDDLKGFAGRNRSCALSRVYENGNSKGILVFIARDSDKEWSNRDRKVLKNITQILSTVIYRTFMENELAESQEHLQRLAYYNIDTGIPNRSAFERDFTINIGSEKSGAVIALEISNLKDLSEIYNTKYANEIVRSIAEYIAAIPTENKKMVYRFSADILFVTILGGSREESRKLAQTILTKFRTPWFLNDNETRLDMHAGISMFPDDADDAVDCVKVTTRALRLAKKKNLSDALSYSEGLEEELDDSRRIRERIISSAENDFEGFYFLYTPVVDAQTGELNCCEAHLFWRYDDTIVPRERFLPIINRTGKAAEIYEFVVERICEFCAAVREAGLSGFRVSFAIPENMLGVDESILILRKALLEYSLPPEAISVSLSEKDNTLGSHSTAQKQLSAIGVNIIADDKGGKFFTDSALNNPFVKLIKLRYRRLSDEPVSSAFVRSLIERAHEKGVAVCIKGVDNAAALEQARSFGADMVQGIINGRPLHTSEFIQKMVLNHHAAD